jgi:Alpha/beta hydrolase family
VSPARAGARSLLLVHGAGSGPRVFDGWPASFPAGLRLETVDLHEGLDPAHATMAQYADAVARAAERLDRPLVIVAWSMGGLAAMMAADCADGLVLPEASTPAEVQGVHRDVWSAPGVFDPEAESRHCSEGGGDDARGGGRHAPADPPLVHARPIVARPG